MFFRNIRSAVVVAAVAVPALAQAQAAPARDTLAAAVITATRVAVTTVAPTATTTVIRGDDLRAQGISRVIDALRTVPGAMVVGSGGIGSQTSLFLRGGNSDYVRVLIDGVPVNDPGGFLDLANLTTANIDRIEIVRGPASVLYGSEAVTGVIQLFTRDGSGAATSRGMYGRGNHGAQRSVLDLSGGTATTRFTLGGARESTDGILAFNNRYTNDVLSASYRSVLDAATDFRAAIRWSSSDFHYPTDYSGAVVDSNSEAAEHRFTASVDAGHRFGNSLEFRTTLTSNEYLPRSNDGPDYKGDTLGFYGYYSRTTRTRRAADMRFTWRPAARQAFTFGGETAHDRESTSSLSLSQYGNSPDGFVASRHNFGLYAQAIGDLSDTWSYSLGARRDDNNAFGIFTTKRASLAWLAGPTTRWRASYGTAFKAPSFFQNFATGYTVGNPALQPEQSRSTELAVDKWLFDGTLAVTIAAYKQQFTNIIQYTGSTPTPGAPNYYNVAAADANGVEADLHWTLTNLLRITAAYAFTDTKTTAAGFDNGAGASYVKGERLIRRPPHTYSLGINRAFTGGGSMQITTTHIGERDDRDFTVFPTAAVKLPAYTRVDASMTFPTGSDGYSLVFRADNALGAKYDDVAHFAAPGAILFVGLQYQK